MLQVQRFIMIRDWSQLIILSLSFFLWNRILDIRIVDHGMLDLCLVCNNNKYELKVNFSHKEKESKGLVEISWRRGKNTMENNFSTSNKTNRNSFYCYSLFLYDSQGMCTMENAEQADWNCQLIYFINTSVWQTVLFVIDEGQRGTCCTWFLPQRELKLFVLLIKFFTNSFVTTF